MEIITPSRGLLEETFGDSRDGILITPFFSKSGLDMLNGFFQIAEICEFWTKLNVFDWQAGYADLPDICSRLRQINERSGSVNVWVKSDLHAKAYFARDTSRAILASSNLTALGFGSNLEVGVSLSGDECRYLISWIDNTRRLMGRIDLQHLIDAVELTQDAIPPVAKEQAILDLEDNEDFQAAVEIFEGELLGSITLPEKAAVADRRDVELIPGRAVVRPTTQDHLPDLPPPWPSYQNFLDFCNEEGSEAAETIISRAEGENNLSGHVKHFFYGALLFFFEYPNTIQMISDNLSEREHVAWNEEPWIGAWHTFLSNHGDETYTDINFSFRTLRVYMPTRLGGTTTTGGAGTGTFKRVLPLIKSMLLEVGAI